MENLSHSRQPTRVSHTSATKRACNGSSFTGKNTYDDVFGGPPRFGGPSLSPRPEDYSEIFGGFHASRATSIPVLDLPLLGDEEMFFEVRSSSFDYGEVFGGFNGLEFAASFEELMRQANSGGDRDHDGDSSDEAWTPAETECLSEESDHSGLDQYSFNGDSYEPINSSKEFNISYHKTDQRSCQDMYNGVTRVAELHSLPECAHVFEETIPLDKAHGQNPEVHVTDDDVNLEFPAGQMREKHLSKMLRSSNRAVDEVKAIGNLESQSTDGRIGSYSNQAFVSISEISLRTQPSELPPPTRPPPMLDSNKGDCWDNKTPTPDKRTGDNSPTYFDVEIDASSAAAASAAAMKEAMENAQAKLRSAKEVMERKGHGVQTHKRVPSKHGGMDKREKARMIADESFDMDDEPLQRAHEKGKREEKISVTYDGGKAMITTQMLPGSIGGEKHFSVTKKYMEDKQTRKLKSSTGVYNVNGADEWQEAAQFFDLVRTDKLVLEEVREANLLLKNPKIHEPQQKQGKVVTEALKQQRETETEVTTVRQDHDLEKIERDLRLAKEAYWKPESNGRPDVEKQAVRVKVNEKKFEVPQDVSKLEKNATKSRTTQHHSERGKKIPEANEAEKHGRIETRPADNELEIEQVRTYNTYDDPKLQQKQSKHGEMPERGHERKLVLSFEQSDNEKMLKRSLEQEEKERKLKEVRRREEKKKKEKEACEQEEKAQKEREAREREEKEKREGEALEREKEKKDWEARQPEEGEKERELRKREEQENKEKEARKREEEEKRKRDELKRKEHEWEEMEARTMDEEDRRIREAFIQEKQKMKQTEACKREEEEKRKREILKREEQERKEREARKQEEEAKKERERLEQEENERKQREAFEREENARKEKEWLELEESERIWRMALEQLENERILKQTFWHSENDEKTRKDPEAEELEKKQKEVHEIKEKDRKPRQTADMVKNEKQQKGTVKVEETETRHQLAHEKETNNGLEDASRKEGHGRINTKFHEKEGIEKMVVIDDKDVRPKEALDGEGEKKSEDVSVHEETKEVKSEHDTCYNFQKEKIVKNMKTVEGNDDLQLENGLKLPAEALEQDTTRKLLDDDDLFQHESKNQAKSVGDEARRNSEKIKSTSRVECNRENQESKFTNGHSGRGKSMETASNQLGKLEKSVSTQALKESTEAGRKADVAKSLFSEGKANVQKISQQVKTSHATEKKDNSIREIHAAEQAGRIKKEREMEMERIRKMEEQREREREREKDRMAVDRVTREARDGAYAESRERAERTAVERATAEARNRTLAEARERLEKACSEAREKSYTEARLRADRTAVERATTEARERAMEKAMAERAAADTNERIERSLSDKYSSSRNNEMRGLKDQQFRRAETFGGSRFSSAYNGVEGESAQRCKARLDRYRRTAERAAKALEEKNMRDLLAQKEQAERHRLAETLGADVKRWASGKEGNLRALLSTLQYILGPDSGWQPIPLTEVITSAAVKKAYRRATLCVHPDKLQQRGASIQQKYICEKVFDLLKEAWNKFNSEER